MPLNPRIRARDHGFEVARPAPYSDEKHLEDLVRDDPWRVLPWEDFGGDDALPPLVVGQQVGLGPSGVADLIAVSEDGYLTVVECKLDRNAEVRRSVVGQILGYASYLRGLTPEEFEAVVIRPYFDRKEGLRGSSFADGIGRLRAEARGDVGASPADWSEEKFLTSFRANLRAGRMRLLIVVDKLNDELRRIVEFLSEATASQIQVVGCGLTLFESATGQILVPELCGVRMLAPVTPSRQGDVVPLLDETSYRANVASDGGRRLLDALKELETERRLAGDRLKWNPRSVVYRAQLPGGETTVLWAELSDVAVPLGRLKEIASGAKHLEDRLREIPPFALPIAQGKREAWVVYRKQEFTPEHAEQLVAALREFLAQSDLQGAGDPSTASDPEDALRRATPGRWTPWWH